MAQLLHLRQQVKRHHRCHRHRHHHADQNRDDVSNAKWGEQTPLDARQHKQGHKHQHDDQGGVNDGGADFERGLGDDFRHRPGHGECTVELEATQHVLHPHHGIVHELTNGNGQATQRHGVDGQTHVMKDQNRDQQRDRNRRERNQRGSYIEQKQKQNHGDKNGTVTQRLFHVGHRVLDEVRLLEQELRGVHTCRQTFGELGHGFLNGPCERHAVCAGLFLHRQNHGRLAAESRITALDGWRQLHLRDLFEQNWLTVFHRDHQILQVFDSRGAANLANQVLAPLGFQKAAAGVGTKILQRGLQLFPLDTQCF